MLTGPNAHVYLEGEDICKRFGIIYTDESERHPPEKRTNYITLPAVDGVLDASEMWTDDVVFGQRQETMVFFVPDELDFEQVKTDLSNYLDGRRFDYSYGFDLRYTLNGRFRVVDYSGWRLHRIEVEVDADPWKRGEHRCYSVNGAGGTEVTVENARRHVGPIFSVQQPTLVEYEGRAWEIPETGQWRLDMRLREGKSVIYVNSAPTMSDTTVDEWLALLGGVKLSMIPKSKRLSDFYMTKGDRPTDSQYRVQIDYDLYDL